MTRHENTPEMALSSVTIPLANACAALFTKELAQGLKALPVARDTCGRFRPYFCPAGAPLFAELHALTAMGLVVRDGQHYRLSTAGSLVLEALEDFGPGEDSNAAAVLVDAALPNLDGVSRERAIVMAETLLARCGEEAIEALLSRGV